MTPIEERLDRAIRALDLAQELADRHPSLAAAQAYGAMLAAAEAHLQAKGVEVPRSHHAVQTQLNKLYHQADVSDNPAKTLSRAYAWKEDDDYKKGDFIGAEEIASIVIAARSFIDRVLVDADIDLEERRRTLNTDQGPSIADLHWLADRGGLGR